MSKFKQAKLFVDLFLIAYNDDIINFLAIAIPILYIAVLL